jgi:acetylornithine deacetylase/succinyl-diaminopimelate desuccinylase-like protein
MVRRFAATLVLLLGVTLATPGARSQQASPAASPLPAQPNLATLATEAQVWLADLIRINTSNPPGNELAAANYAASVLRKENITAEVLELVPGRGVVVARLQAGPLPDPSRALLLVSHLDVVGVDPAKWSVDAFGGVIKDGHLYGRGAIDGKGMVAANLAAFIGLKRAGVRLNRDVIFLAGADEEESGAASLRVVIEKHWDKIACAFALSEGGRVLLRDGKTQYVGVQASEKVPYNVSVIATGSAGHGSVPRPDNALVKLAAAVEKIAAYRAPAQPITLTRRYFERLATVEDEDTARWMRALETPQRLELAAGRLSEMSPVWSSMLRDTVAPTQLRAGVRSNVVPSEAWANLNVGLLPGNSIDALVAQLQKAVNDPHIRFAVVPGGGVSAPPSSPDSELFQAIQRVVPQQFPGAVVVPFLSTGATDSATLRLRNVQALGLLPFPLTEADEQRARGDDERLPLASFRTGVEFLYRVVYEFAAVK